MSRSGYVDDIDYTELNLYRGRVARAMQGKRGQSFLRELGAAMDAMPVKELIADELIDRNGKCCAIGAVCQSRNIDVSEIDYDDPESVGHAVGIAESMAAEIEYMNDEAVYYSKTPAERWARMRKWISEQTLEAKGEQHANTIS